MNKEQYERLLEQVKIRREKKKAKLLKQKANNNNKNNTFSHKSRNQLIDEITRLKNVINLKDNEIKSLKEKIKYYKSVNNDGNYIKEDKPYINNNNSFISHSIKINLNV